MAGRLCSMVGWLARFVAAAVVIALGVATPQARGQCASWENRSGAVGGGNGNRPYRGPINPMAYDSARGVTVEVDSYVPGFESVSAVFEYTGSNWSRRIPAGPELDGPRFGFSLTYDAARARTVFFGGYKGIGGAARSTNTLALWNGVSWQVVPPSGLWPPASGQAISTYDPYRRRVIVLVSEPNLSNAFQTWEWTGTVWEKGPNLANVCQTCTEMVFDIRRNRAFVSTASTGAIQEVWELTPGATAAQGVWNRVTILGDPYEATIGAGLVYDPYRFVISRTAGRGYSGIWSYGGETYQWNVGTSRWTLALFNPRPQDRGGPGVAFDTARDRIVLFGGIEVYIDSQGVGGVRNYDDTWEFVDPSPGFLRSPSNATVDGGDTAIFAAATIGENLSLQWIKDGTPVAGATGTLLAVPSAAASSQGWYWLRASNACGVRDSAAGYLTVRPPVNNSFASPSTVYATQVFGTTLGATNDATSTCGASGTSPDVWHAYTVPADGTLSIDTCGSEFDTVLSVNTCCSGAGSVVTCNDDAPTPGPGCLGTSSALSFPVTRGQRFLFRIAGFQGAVGRYTLNTRLLPLNNACAVATEVFAGGASGTTVGSTADGATNCGNFSAGPDIWYRFRSDCSGSLILSTESSGFDTVLSVHSGCPGTAANTLACNDDVFGGITYSQLAVNVGPGGDYRIRVSGYNGATGTVVLRVAPPAPGGDACAGAVAIGLGDTPVGTRCAASEGLPGPPWCEGVVGTGGGTPQYDRWYRYSAVQPGILQVRLCNTTFSPIVAAYSAVCPTSGYSALACSARDDSCGTTPMIEIPTLPGEVYLLRVGGTYGLNNIAGTGTMNLALVEYETGACCINNGCQQTAAHACAGVFNGEGSVCGPAACPAYLGACCVGTTCQLLSAAACGAAAGATGVFNGAGVACPGPGLVLPACCRADFDRSGTKTVDDIFIYLNAWFVGDARCDVDIVAGLQIDDIFVYLNLWFAGCG